MMKSVDKHAQHQIVAAHKDATRQWNAPALVDNV